jgi:hypothetical protein
MRSDVPTVRDFKRSWMPAMAVFQFQLNEFDR